MVRIRLTRIGRRHKAIYRIGVFDSHTRRDGRSVEIVGHYDPANPDPAKEMKIEKERISYWLDRGAQPSETVASIIKKMGYDSKTKTWKDVVKAAPAPASE